MPENYSQNQSHPPVKCGQDCMTLLARDPHWLYVYWDITDERKKELYTDLGKNFFDRSIPVLKITNISKSEYFYVRINEFSNNWYVNVSESNCFYLVEIGRKVSDNYFVSILNSNSIITPSDSISDDNTAYFANYTDVRDGRLNFKSTKKHDIPVLNFKSPDITHISSQEFLNPSTMPSQFGESSAQYYVGKVKG